MQPKTWSKPQYKDKRLGFEMTLYILSEEKKEVDKTV